MIWMKKTIHTREYRQFVTLLRQAREEAGLTQIQAGEKIGRPQSHISMIESGQQRVDVIELKRFAKIYNKNILYFLSGLSA